MFPHIFIVYLNYFLYLVNETCSNNLTTQLFKWLKKQVIKGLLFEPGAPISSAKWTLDHLNIVLADRDGVGLVGLVVRG